MGEAAGSHPIEAQDLIDSAWAVLERTGFEGFKVAAVIRAAGSSMKTFYRHFDSKDSLLLALLLDETARAGDRLALRLDRAETPAAQVDAWIDSVIGTAARPNLTARARLFSSLDVLNARFPAEIEAGRQAMLAPLVAALAAGSASGELPLAEPRADAMAIYHLCGRYMVDLLDGTSRVGVEEAIAQAQRFVRRALGAGPPAPDA